MGNVKIDCLDIERGRKRMIIAIKGSLFFIHVFIPESRLGENGGLSKFMRKEGWMSQGKKAHDDGYHEKLATPI